MSGLLKHVFQSAVADVGDASLVQPSNWNDYHTFQGGAHGSLIVRDASDATYGASWIAAVGVGQVLISNGVGALPVWSTSPTLTNLTLGGTLAITGGGPHSISASVAGALQFTLRNTNATGTDRLTSIDIGNDATAQAAVIRVYASGFTTSGTEVQDSLAIRGLRPGGISIASEAAAGVIRFHTGGTTKRWEITNGGHLLPNGNETYNIGDSANTVANFWGASATLGAPATGQFGNGTLNVSSNIYKNGTAYTNPAYVLEHWATGRIVRYADRDGADRYQGLQPLAVVETFARTHCELPQIAQWRAASQGRLGLFDGGDALLASLEEAYLYLFDLAHRIATLEEREGA